MLSSRRKRITNTNLTMNVKSKKGGARPGSGRPETGRNIRVCIKLSKEVVDYLRGIKNKSEYIDNLIRQQL